MKRYQSLWVLLALTPATCSSENVNVEIPPSCIDGLLNEGESDIDCGGPCAQCSDGKNCGIANVNCSSGVCSAGKCQPASCTDGVKNGSEVDADCGGTCGLCSDGKTCAEATQCRSGVCKSGVCQAASCSDAVKNGNELDVDCGGSCGPCGFGKTCSGNADCANGVCAGYICRPPVSCLELLQAQPSTTSGTYRIDPDGYNTGKADFPVVCDMTLDGGGWTRFNWVRAAFPSGQDPLGQTLDQCDPAMNVCSAKIPDGSAVSALLVKDVTANQYAAWKFNATNSTSNAVLGALLNKTTVCLTSGAVWAPYLNTGTRTYCGNGGEGGCKAFYYTNGTCNGKGNTGWGIEFDGDTGCASAAFKEGSTGVGCPQASPMSGAADDYGFLAYFEYKQIFGELYYR